MADKLSNSIVAKPTKENELSPNPANSGFIKQVQVSSLPLSGEPNVLYLIPVYSGENKISGYFKWKWNVMGKWERVIDGSPTIKLKDEQKEPNTQVVTPATPSFEKIFDGNVKINGKLYLGGKLVTVGDDVPGDIDNIDSIEFTGVSLTKTTVGYTANLTLTEDQWTKSIDQETYVIARFHLTNGDVIELPRVYYRPDASTVAFGGKAGDTVYYAILGNSVSLQGQLYEWDEGLKDINESLPEGVEPIELNLFKYKDKWYHILTKNELPDADISVQIWDSINEEWGEEIPWEIFETNSKNKTYSVGTIIKINNGFVTELGTIRFILTDLSHGAGTEWQFYDMPFSYVHLGLPFDAQDYGDGGAVGLQDYLEGNEVYIYPSNKHGYTSAVELQNILNTIYKMFKPKIQNAIRVTELDCYIPRICVSDDYGPLQDYSTEDYVKYEGPDGLNYSKTYQKIYCLSASEVGYDGDEFPTVAIYNEGGEDEETIDLEGSKHDYFETGNGETALAKRIRYYNGEVCFYWIRSPYLPGSGFWGYVSYDGSVHYDFASGFDGVAPAFRI